MKNACAKDIGTAFGIRCCGSSYALHIVGLQIIGAMNPYEYPNTLLANRQTLCLHSVGA